MAVGPERIIPPELQAVQAVLADAVEGAIPAALHALYGELVTARALKWGDLGAVAEALKWRKWLPVVAPDALWDKKRDNAQRMREPLWVPVVHEEWTEAPERILTVEGWLSLEDDYLPRVCTGEHLPAHPEAKAALVVAARTYLLRAMRDHPTLGRQTPVKNGDTFQVRTRSARGRCQIGHRQRRRRFHPVAGAAQRFPEAFSGERF